MLNRDLREMQCMDIHSKGGAKRTTHGGQLCKTARWNQCCFAYRQ